MGPAQASRAVREYLEGLDADGRPETLRKNISITDPAAEWTCAPGGPAFFAYSTNYLVDVLVGQAAFLQLTGSQHGAAMLLRIYQEAFIAAAAATGYSIGTITEAIVDHFKQKSEEMGEAFLNNNTSFVDRGRCYSTRQSILQCQGKVEIGITKDTNSAALNVTGAGICAFAQVLRRVHACKSVP